MEHDPQWPVSHELEMLHRVQAAGSGADIDVRGPAFDFIRSIDVFDARATQHGEREGCDKSENVRCGSYDATGQFCRQPVQRVPCLRFFRGQELYGEKGPLR